MKKFEQSLQDGAYALLPKFAGHWEGVTKVWFKPDEIADESPVSGTIRPILGGRFLLYEYTGSMQGKSLEGMAIIGHYLLTDTWQCAWIDTMHMGTGILFSEDKSLPENPAPHINVLGSYGWEGGPERWGWRTVFQVVNENTLVITAYNIKPEDGIEMKAVETTLRRNPG